MPGLPIRAYATDQLLRAFACMGWRGRRVHEGVHQARKSMRRVRACLALAGFDATGEGKRIDRDLARQCRALSQLRDAQARIETIDRLIETHAPGDAATLLRRVRRGALQERSQQLQRSVAEDAGFSEQREQLRALAPRLDALPWATLTDAQLQAALQHSLKRCRKAEGRALSDGDAEDWHRWRRRRRRLLQQHTALAACAIGVADAIDPQRELAHYLGESQDLSVLFAHFGRGRDLQPRDRKPLVELLRHEMEHKQQQIERWLDEHDPAAPAR
ncbi:MAG: CHAD domain-containing protein [Xanthomonadales bacterium]|nr:CHAD domain-containing protein [Xanthomonadales bacterium]